MNLTLQQFRAVVAVADGGGFTAAAESLHVAQSSLSRTVADVERRLGTPLFTRTTRRLEPTPAGVEFVATARRALAGVEAELRHFDGFLAGHRGSVRVAALPSLAAILLPGILSTFLAARPGVELSLEDTLATEVMDRVRTGRADLALTVVPLQEADLDDLELTLVAVDRFCAIVEPGHRFASYDELPWSALADQPFVAFEGTTSIRQHVDRTLTTTEVRPRRVAAARNIAAVAGLVAAGVGISVVPGLVLPLVEFAGLRHLPLRHPITRRQIAVVRPRHRATTPAAAAFVDLLQDPGQGRPVLPEHAAWVER